MMNDPMERLPLFPDTDTAASRLARRTLQPLLEPIAARLVEDLGE